MSTIKVDTIATRSGSGSVTVSNNIALATEGQIDINSTNSNMQKVALTALAGTSIEWYDFFLYGAAAALIFPKAFFPETDPTIALLAVNFTQNSLLVLEMVIHFFQVS